MQPTYHTHARYQTRPGQARPNGTYNSPTIFLYIHSPHTALFDVSCGLLDFQCFINEHLAGCAPLLPSRASLNLTRSLDLFPGLAPPPSQSVHCDCAYPLVIALHKTDSWSPTPIPRLSVNTTPPYTCAFAILLVLSRPLIRFTLLQICYRYPSQASPFPATRVMFP